MRPFRITVHCSATKDGKRVDIKEIEKWHMKRGFNMVGYHAVIQPDGEIQDGRPLNLKGAHVRGSNDNNLGICLIGNRFFTKDQFESLRAWIHGIEQCYDVHANEIWGHYLFPSAIEQGKSCPNIRIQDLLYWLLTGNYEVMEKYLLY